MELAVVRGVPEAMQLLRPSAMTQTDDRLLFCPFCRECYEGESVCPVHELPLVEFSDLPKQAHEREVAWEEPVAGFDPRFGRAILASGLLLLVAGFFAPILIEQVDDQRLVFSGFQLAMGPAKNFWTVGFVAVMFGYFLYRRRTPIQMLGARLSGMFLGTMPLLSLGYSYWMVRRFVDASQGAITVELAFGAYVIVAASLVLVVGSYRFGRARGAASTRDSDDEEQEEARGIDRGDD